jgi:hypothetical protein
LADWRHQIVAWSTAFTKIRRSIEPKLPGCEALPAVAGIEVLLLCQSQHLLLEAVVADRGIAAQRVEVRGS